MASPHLSTTRASTVSSLHIEHTHMENSEAQAMISCGDSKPRRSLTQGRCVLITQYSGNPSTLVPSRAASRPVKPRRGKARALRRCDWAFQRKLDGPPCAVQRTRHTNELQRSDWNLLGTAACSHERTGGGGAGLPGPRPSSALAAQPPSTAPVLQSGLASQRLTALSQIPREPLLGRPGRKRTRVGLCASAECCFSQLLLGVPRTTALICQSLESVMFGLCKFCGIPTLDQLHSSLSLCA